MKVTWRGIVINCDTTKEVSELLAYLDKMEIMEAALLGEKRCFRCKVVQPMLEFHKWNRSPDGRAYICRRCSNSERIYRRRLKRAQQRSTECS